MKHIKYNLLLLLVAVISGLISCTPEVDDAFDKSATQRSEESISELKEILTGSKTGWIIRMYGNPDYGGYNLLCKFSGEQVTAMSEVYGTGVTETSHFKVDQSQGTILSFDEYNKVIHFFSDPVNPAGMGINGKGFLGDLEFRVQKATPDSIIMTGKKHEDRIVMTPAPEDWKDYLNKVEAVEKGIKSASYKLKVGDVEMATTRNYRCFSATDPATGDVYDLPFIITDKGIELYDTYTLNGHKVSGFTFNNSDTWPEVSDNATSLSAVIVPLNQQVVQGLWFFSHSNMGSAAQQAWTTGYTTMQTNGVTAINMAALGTYTLNNTTGAQFGITLACTLGGTTYLGQLGYKYTMTGDDEITLKYDKYINGNANYFNMFGFSTINTFIEGTYKITTDNIKDPSYLLLTDKTDSNKWFKLSTEEVTDVMNN